MDNGIRSVCQQYGTLLQFRTGRGIACANYETHSIAKGAVMSMNGKTVANSIVTAEVTNEQECMNALEATSGMSNGQPGPFNNTPSFGGLWATPGQPPVGLPQTQTPPTIPFGQPNFPPVSFGGQVGPGPSAMGMNGPGFNHWGMPTNNPPVLPQSNQWGPVPPQQQQPANVFPGYTSGWLPAKPVEQGLPGSMFSPNVDHCLPSELLNFTREQGS